MPILIKHSLFKVSITDNAKVNYDRTCTYRIVDSSKNKSGLWNNNEYPKFR